MYVCIMYLCMYVCMYVYMYICMHVCMHACKQACMYVCMYVQGGSNMTGTDLCVNKPHCAAAVRP